MLSILMLFGLKLHSVYFRTFCPNLVVSYRAQSGICDDLGENKDFTHRIG